MYFWVVFPFVVRQLFILEKRGCVVVNEVP